MIMTKFLLQLFVKDYKNTESAAGAFRHRQTGGMTGIVW